MSESWEKIVCRECSRQLVIPVGVETECVCGAVFYRAKSGILMRPWMDIDEAKSPLSKIMEPAWTRGMVINEHSVILCPHCGENVVSWSKEI